jgi:hypothetical protein
MGDSMSTIINATTTNGVVIQPDNSGSLALQTNNGTAAVTIDTSQNLQFNSGFGSVATAYGCRAWVNFNGTGTVAIRASGNVTSITDNGTGDYTVNFTTTMTDANYSTVGTCQFTLAGDRNIVVAAPYNAAPTTSAIRICTTGGTTASLLDMLYVNVSVFR